LHCLATAGKRNLRCRSLCQAAAEPTKPWMPILPTLPFCSFTLCARRFLQYRNRLAFRQSLRNREGREPPNRRRNSNRTTRPAEDFTPTGATVFGIFSHHLPSVSSWPVSDGRQFAFGLRRAIPLALPRDLAIEVACFAAEAMTRSHGASSPLMRSARKSTIILSSCG